MRHREGQRVVDVGHRRGAAVVRVGQHVAHQLPRVDALQALGNSVQCKSAAAKVAHLEAHRRKLVLDALIDHQLLGLEMQAVGEEQLLRVHLARGQPVAVLLKEYAHMGAMLVYDHQARLDRSHDVSALVLVVCGRFLLDESVGRRLLLVGKEHRGRCLAVAIEALVELFPPVGHPRPHDLPVVAGPVCRPGRMGRQGCGTGVEGIILRVVVPVGHLHRVVVGIENGNVGLALGVKLDGRRVVEHPHGILDRCHQDLVDGLLVLKLDLGLGGMDIHVDILGVDIEIEEIRYLVALRHQPLVGRHHRLVEIGVTHVASVDEEILVSTLFLGRLGLAHKAVDAADRGLKLNRQQVLVDALAENIDNALAQAATLEIVHLRPVARERERQLGIDQHDALEGTDDVVEFGAVGFEKLATGGNVEKQVLDQEVGTYGACTRLLTGKAGAGNGEMGAKLLGGQACFKLHLRHGGYRCQGLAAETHCPKIEQIVGKPDLGCGMTFERQSGIGLGHALAVVDDLYGRAAGVDHQHVDAGGTGIDGVLYQLLDDRCRALDNLAGRNLIGHRVGKKLYDIAHKINNNAWMIRMTSSANSPMMTSNRVHPRCRLCRRSSAN